MKNRKEIILDVTEDLVSNFLFYDRKGDEDLPRGSIEEAILEREVFISEIVSHFDGQLRKALRA